MTRQDSAKNRWATSWRGTVLLLFLLAVAAVALVIRAPWKEQSPAPEVSDGNQLAGELAHLELLGQALKLHADEHDGRYPASIGDIEWRQAQPGLDASGLPAVASRFHHPDTHKVMDWLYYPGHTESDAAETVLVASPVAVGPHLDRRMVSRVNGITELAAESDFQRQVGLLP